MWWRECKVVLALCPSSWKKPDRESKMTCQWILTHTLFPYIPFLCILLAPCTYTYSTTWSCQSELPTLKLLQDSFTSVSFRSYLFFFCFFLQHFKTSFLALDVLFLCHLNHRVRLRSKRESEQKRTKVSIDTLFAKQVAFVACYCIAHFL